MTREKQCYNFFYLAEMEHYVDLADLAWWVGGGVHFKKIHNSRRGEFH